MSECSGNCSSCATDCAIKCPVCHANSTKVDLETVKSILKDSSQLIEEDMYICLNRRCEVTYFNTSQYYQKDELKVKIWFKEKIDDMMVCYCHNISMKDIKEAVEKGMLTKEEIKKFYKKETKEDCVHKNPIGKSCHKLFENAIEYYKGE